MKRLERPPGYTPAESWGLLLEWCRPQIELLPEAERNFVAHVEHDPGCMGTLYNGFGCWCEPELWMETVTAEEHVAAVKGLL